MAEFDEEESTPINATSTGSNKGVTNYGNPQRTMEEEGDDVKSANKLASDYEGDINKREKKTIEGLLKKRGGAAANASPAAAAKEEVIDAAEYYLKDDYPLHLACEGGASLDVIKYLVEEADDDKGKELLGKVDMWGRYPLHWACRGGASLDVIKYLVEEAGGDKGKEPLGKADGLGMYPLHWACYGGASIDVIKYLIQKNPGQLQYRDKISDLTALDCIKDKNAALKETLLHWVQEFLATKNNQAMDGGSDSASPAANREISVEECLKQKYPLHWACWEGASLKVIKYLVEEADGDKGKELLGKADNKGWYPLHCACGGGASLNVIKYLVEEAGGDKGKELLGKADKDGDYPLHLAFRGGASLDVIKYLVEEAGGDKGKELLGKEDKDGRYPLHWACRWGASIDVIKYLVEEADGDKGKELIGKADKDGRYPLHFACWGSGGASLDVIKYLVEEADGDKGKELLGKADSQGMYPLDLLEGASREDVVKYLIQKNPGPLQIKDDSPFINSVKYFFGMECQSTIWNETDEVVYVIVTDRTMETVNTNATSANIAGNTPGGSAGITHTKKDNKGPTPPQMTPILPRDFHTFNLESKDYYLTYYTKDFASGRNVFHEVNLRMEGKNDYMIKPHCLEHVVEREPRLAWEIFVLSVPVSVSDMDTTTPPVADDVGQGQDGSSQGGADSSRGGAGQGSEGQGEGDDTSGNNNRGDNTSGNNNRGDDTSGNNNRGDDTSGNNNRGRVSRFNRSVKYFLGMKCQSTIWNETDEVVYVFVTDRTIGDVNTIATSISVSPKIAGKTPSGASIECTLGSVGFNHSNQRNLGPTPPQMTPIPPRDFHTFNLESKDYYLSYYTKTKTKLSENGEVFDCLDFHQMNIKLRGKDDYKIYPKHLERYVERVKAEVMSKKAVLGFVTPNHPYQNGTGTVGDTSAPQPVSVGDTRAAMRALRVLGGICGVLLLFMLLLWVIMRTQTDIPDEKEL